MILLLTEFANERCAATLAKATGREVELASDLRRARRLLKRHDLELVVIDESRLEGERVLAELLQEPDCGALPLPVNLAIMGPERLVREVRVGLARAEQQRRAARQVAAAQLRGELGEDLTGILLSSRLALEGPALPSYTQEKLMAVCELAERARTRLESSARAS